MQLTKYEHSCLDIASGESRLIIDPGVFSKSLVNFEGITAVVITHIHPDHFDPAKIKAIIQKNSNVKIYTTEEVAKEVNDSRVSIAQSDSPVLIGDFNLEFFGKDHAEIAPSYPLAQNFGVLVNNSLYHPGDSFTVCPKQYSWLSTPVMAPWLKFSELAEFVFKSNASNVFPTHNGFLNEDGHRLYDRILGKVCEEQSKNYHRINPGQSVKLLAD